MVKRRKIEALRSAMALVDVEAENKGKNTRFWNAYNFRVKNILIYIMYFFIDH